MKTFPLYISCVERVQFCIKLCYPHHLKKHVQCTPSLLQFQVFAIDIIKSFQLHQFILMIGPWWHLRPIQDNFLHSPSPAKVAEAYCVGTFLSRFPLSGERSSGCGGEMLCWSCPFSSAEIHFSTVRLLMVPGSVSGAVLIPGSETC